MLLASKELKLLPCISPLTYFVVSLPIRNWNILIVSNIKTLVVSLPIGIETFSFLLFYEWYF